MWIEISTFALKTGLITVAILVVVGGITLMIVQSPRRKSGLKVENLNTHYDELAFCLDQNLLPKKAFKKKVSQQRKQKKAEAKEHADEKKHVFVLDFDGDIKADAVESLREEISAILTVAQPEEELFLRLESPGGVVNGYGLAAAQLVRARDAGMRVVVGIDKVAASGGYMMACVAHEILASPFAIVGSIGVLAQVPNVNRLLKRFDIDYNEFTAGAYKRTVSVFGENTAEGVEKFRAQLDATHELFKQHVAHYRPHIDLNTVTTGEYWYGHQALPLNLVDKLQTTDQWLLDRRESHRLVRVLYQRKQKWQEKIADVLTQGIVTGVHRAINVLQGQDLH